MTTIALGSVKGAPGVTTTALAMAAVWPAHRRLLIVELDPDGGVLAARRDLGVEPGLIDMIAALLRGDDAIDATSQRLDDAIEVIVAPPSPAQVRASIAAAGARLWPALHCGRDVLVDCGRLRATSPCTTVAAEADAVLLLARPRLEDVALLRDQVPVLRGADVDPGVVLLDDGPYADGEVAAAVDAPVVARLPFDRRTSAALNGTTAGRSLARSRLLRAVRHLVTTIAGRQSVAVDAPTQSDRA